MPARCRRMRKRTPLKNMYKQKNSGKVEKRVAGARPSGETGRLKGGIMSR